jgi:hypothetical protein
VEIEAILWGKSSEISCGVPVETPLEKTVERAPEKSQSSCGDFRKNFRRSLESSRRNPGSSKETPLGDF